MLSMTYDSMMLAMVFLSCCLINIFHGKMFIGTIRRIRRENKCNLLFSSKTDSLMTKSDVQPENFNVISILESKSTTTAEQLSILQNMDRLLKATRKKSVASALKRFKMSLSERKSESESEIEAFNIDVIQDRIKSKTTSLSFSGLAISLHSLYHIKVTILHNRISDSNLKLAVDILCEYILQNILALLSNNNDTALHIKPKYFSLFLYTMLSIKRLTWKKINFEGLI